MGGHAAGAWESVVAVGKACARTQRGPEVSGVK